MERLGVYGTGDLDGEQVMGTPRAILPESFLKCMSKEDRAPMGKAGVTNAEADAKLEAKSETQLQNHIAGLLNQRDLFFIRNRMDKRPTVRVGMPDFIVIFPGGNALAMEVKHGNGQCSEEQVDLAFEYFHKTKTHVEVVRSLAEAKTVLDRELEKPPAPKD